MAYLPTYQFIYLLTSLFPPTILQTNLHTNLLNLPPTTYLFTYQIIYLPLLQIKVLKRFKLINLSFFINGHVHFD
jgi:hypothetical protein